jgi:2,3-diketo-5-methylthiopentyl-1-phosphate enolase
MDYAGIYYPMAESITSDEYVIATYMLITGENKQGLQEAIEVAIDQSTGTWTPVPGETEEVKAKHRARVVGVYEMPKAENENESVCVAQIAFPQINFGHSISMIFSTVLGNNSSMGFIKLLDRSFPEDYLRGFRGPKFGITGIRGLLDIPERPLLCSIFKPCTGLSPEVGAELAYRSALGGADIIKDDELLADTSFSPVKERASHFMRRIAEADKEKGEKTLYMINITDRPDRMLEHALRAIEAGANALMINHFAVGLDSVRMITENEDIQVPVLGHCTMSGALSFSPKSGFDVALLVGKLSRIVGLDISLLYMPGGRFYISEATYIQAVQMMQKDLFGLRPILPMPGGSIQPGVVDKVIELSGKDCVISAGGGIQGHPEGPTAGARAMRQAIELAMLEPGEARIKEEKFTEYRAAVAKWGKTI